VKTTHRIFAEIVLCLLVVSCSDRLSQGDERLLQALNDRYGTQFEFSTQNGLYLRMRSRSSSPVPLETAREVFEAFWLGDDSKPRVDTELVYLNVYRHDGTFQVQLYWDPESSRIVESTTEHY
jgi:hypothetical protein